MVFLGGQVLPGNVGRAILGPFADQRAVDTLNHSLGVDRPLLTQYWSWISGFVQGDMGTSYVLRRPVAPEVIRALGNSLKLAAVAFALVVPIGILGGVVAALNLNRPLDRIISLGGLSVTVLPEFVTGIILILIFGVWLRWLPISAAWPRDAGFFTQLYYLILPSLPLFLVLFGYIARMGTVDHQTIRKAIYFGSALGSFCVEGIGPKRLLDVGAKDLDKRMQQFMALVETGGPVTLPE